MRLALFNTAPTVAVKYTQELECHSFNGLCSLVTADNSTADEMNPADSNLYAGFSGSLRPAKPIQLPTALPYDG